MMKDTTSGSVVVDKHFLSKVSNNIAVSTLTFIYKHAIIILLAIATFLSLYAKCRVVMYPTGDVVNYILDWMDGIHKAGISNFYTVDADYSPIYLFFIGVLSFVPGGAEIEISGYVFNSNWMIALKCCYFAVDILNAIAVYIIIRYISGSKTKAAIGYLIMMALPVQFINSAVWGNCDCIYACFLLYSLYFSLRQKSLPTFMLFGFALANKLQALFLAPFLVYMLLRRKLKFSAILCVPFAVLVSFLPAYICGANFLEPFAFYGKQVRGYNKLTLGCPNFWQLFAFRESSTDIISRGATFWGLLIIGVLFSLVWLRMIDATKSNLLNVAVFLIGVTVFFLPHMHERYFYMIDILVVVYSIIQGKRYFMIVLMQLASGIAYYHYISGYYFIHTWGEDSVHIAAALVIVVLSIVFYDILLAQRITTDKVISEFSL